MQTNKKKSKYLYKLKKELDVKRYPTNKATEK